MKWLGTDFLARYGTWIVVATAVWFGLSVQSSVLAAILNVVQSIRRATPLPRWLKTFAKVMKNLHATLLVVSGE